MKKLLLISNPSVLGKNLENILKQNYHTDFISTVPKQIGSIPFNSYNALLLDFTLLHEYSLIICKTAKKALPKYYCSVFMRYQYSRTNYFGFL